jgi:glycosyltransferase involved in cell wall biosynthesis
MQLAFVIPAYNEEGLIGRCLESVTKRVKESGIEAEIIVVNNASKDRTKKSGDFSTRRRGQLLRFTSA